MSFIYRYIFSLLCVLCMVQPCMANGTDDRYYVFSEYFQGDFPPAEWSLKSTNTAHTWRKVDSTANGKLKTGWEAYPYFVYVGGPSGQEYDESLISPMIFENQGECEIEIGMACEPGFSMDEDFDLSLDLSYDFGTTHDPTWETILSIKNDNDDNKLECNSGENYWFYSSTSEVISSFRYWVRLRYAGTSGTGIALFSVASYCFDSAGYNPDQNKCGIIFYDPSVTLALFMVLVGFAALLISRK